MISRYNQTELSWIDLESPTREELESLSEEFELHPVVIAELAIPSERPKVDLYENSIYLILHFPIRNKSNGRIEEVEVDFLLQKNTLITTHYELVAPLHDFAKMFELDGYLSRGIKGQMHAGYLFFFALRELYKHSLFILESTAHDIRDIEKHIFSGEESLMVSRISHTNRTLIDIKQSTRYHRETLKSLQAAATGFYGADFTYYTNAIMGEFERLEHILAENKETLRDLRETNDSLLTSKSTATIKRLTAVNVIILPLALISWIFAMHSKYLYLDEPTQLLAVFGAMALIFLSSFIYFRRKKWL